MPTSPLHRCLIAARAAISGDFSSTSRVIDTLLDLRQLAQGEPEMAGLIDSILATIPGRSVVTNEWWTAVLNQLDRACGNCVQFSAVST